MKFILEIECDNAAFDQTPETQVAYILEEAARRLLEEGYSFDTHPESRFRDENGNTCGRWYLR